MLFVSSERWCRSFAFPFLPTNLVTNNSIGQGLETHEAIMLTYKALKDALLQHKRAHPLKAPGDGFLHILPLSEVKLVPPRRRAL